MIDLVFKSGLFWNGKIHDLMGAKFGLFLTGQMVFAFGNGVQALDDALCAAVLAWKMPPVTTGCVRCHAPA